MQTQGAIAASSRGKRPSRLWKGNGRPSRWFIRIIILFILYQVINWLWQNSLLTIRWAQPGKIMGFIFLGIMVLVAISMVGTGWRLVSSLGVRGVIILLVVWYVLAVGVKLLWLPPDQPLRPALPEQMVAVVEESVLSVRQSISSIPKAIEELQFAYLGQRDLMDLPGVDEPTEPLNGPIIGPYYFTIIETATPVPEPETIEATPTPLPSQ
jgi:hypothetical protein